MAKPVIGWKYRLDIPEKLLGESVPWVNARSNTIAKLWEEIVGEIVIVKARTRLLSVYCIVSLLAFPKDTFYVPEKRLMEITRRLPLPCSCEMRIIMTRGCVLKKNKTKKINVEASSKL